MRGDDDVGRQADSSRRKGTLLTLVLEEDLLVEARAFAARNGTSLEEIVRRHLADLVRAERRRTAWERVRSLVESPKARIDGPLPPRGHL